MTIDLEDLKRKAEADVMVHYTIVHMLIDEVKQTRRKAWRNAFEKAAVFFETHMAALCTGPGQNGEVKMVRTSDGAIDPAQAAQAAAMRAIAEKEPA